MFYFKKFFIKCIFLKIDLVDGLVKEFFKFEKIVFSFYFLLQSERRIKNTKMDTT